MRTVSALFAVLALSLSLGSPALSVAPENPLAAPAATRAPSIQLACTPRECRALCPDLKGAKYKRCYNDCRKRKENC